MKRFVTAILTCVAALASMTSAQSAKDVPLFHIERSKNANIVQYDVRVTPEGTLYRKEPIVAYWIRHAEQGQRRDLSWLQRTFAYGFDAERAEDGESARLELKADIGRELSVEHDGEAFRAITRIDGEPSYLEWIFIDSAGEGLSTQVNFIELHGRAIAGGGKRYEKFIP
jgi:hypothetical protein